TRRCDDENVAFPCSVGLAHPRIDRQLRVILHVNDSVRSRERVDHQKIFATLENLERKIMVGSAWNSQHVALRFRVGRRPLGAVFVALCERFGQVRDRTSTHDALPCRYRGDGTELPKVFKRVRRVTLQIPISRVQRLPDTVQVGAIRNAFRPLQLLRLSGADGEQYRCRCHDRADESISHYSLLLLTSRYGTYWKHKPNVAAVLRPVFDPTRAVNRKINTWLPIFLWIRTSWKELYGKR